MSKKSDEKILRINFSVNIQSLDPHLITDIRSHSICKALYEGLSRVNQQGVPELAAAATVDISTCKKKYTFILRDTKWSNGEKVTAHHFVNAWEKALSPNSRCIHVKRFFLIKNARKFYEGKVSFEAVGIRIINDYSLTIELEHPAPYFLQLVADPIYSPIYETESEPHIFNGPFVIENYELNKHLILTANPLYWDSQRVKLKKIQVSFIKDAQTAFSMYQANQLDYLGSPFICLPDEVIPKLDNLKIKQASAPFWMFFNVRNPKLKSAKIRKALAYTINREEIIKQVIPYQKEALYQILPKALSSTNEELYLKNLDIKKAQALFEEGLQELGLKKADFQLTLSLCSNPEQKKITPYLKHQWEKIFKIKINLREDDWNSFISKLISGDYEVGGSFNCNIYDDPTYFLETFLHSYNNLAKWENKIYQKYFNLAKNSLDTAERKKYLKAAEGILLEDMPVIPIYNHAHLYVCKDNLINFSPPEFNYLDFKWVYFQEN